MNRIVIFLVLEMLVLAYSASGGIIGEEFQIAATTANEFGLAAAFDGTNYLVAICGDESTSFAITAQLISRTGRLVGDRISTGRVGWLPLVAFGETNFLIVWQDAGAWNDVIYGQLVATSGALVGPAFPISGTPGIVEPSGVAFDDTNYLVIWEGMLSGSDEAVFGQLISQNGDFVGSRINISGNRVNQNQAALAFDGDNYLVVWTDGSRSPGGRAEDIYGRFVRPSGKFVSSEFLIEQNSYSSDNIIAIAFDGNNYLVIFHDLVNDQWDIYARPVSRSGTVGSRITVSDGPGNQELPFAGLVDFDGTNYLIPMAGDWGAPIVTAKARYFDTVFNPVGDWFTIFESQDAKIPFGASVVYGDGKFMAVTTKAIYTPASDIPFGDGDVHGVFIESLGDSDNDGVNNTQDNCPDAYNPDQSDEDEDGVGDLCDNCPHINNPDQEDSDRDGKGDACECLREIPADMNGDCYVNLEDFAVFVSQWLECSSPSDPACN